MIHSFISKKLPIYCQEKTPTFFFRNDLFLMYSFGPRTITTSVYVIISWCPMYRLLRTSDSANFIFEIQVTCLSVSYTLTFGLETQNFKLRGMESATKFCNWICRSNWEYRHSLFVNSILLLNEGNFIYK